MGYRVIHRKDGRAKVLHDSTRKGHVKRSKLDVGAYGCGPGGWPMWSDAAGISPNQIAEQKAEDKKHGIDVEYGEVGSDNEGCVKFDNPSQRKKYCETYGLFDLNGGYSDPQRGGRN